MNVSCLVVNSWPSQLEVSNSIIMWSNELISEWCHKSILTRNCCSSSKSNSWDRVSRASISQAGMTVLPSSIHGVDFPFFKLRFQDRPSCEKAKRPKFCISIDFMKCKTMIYNPNYNTIKVVLKFSSCYRVKILRV